MFVVAHVRPHARVNSVVGHKIRRVYVGTSRLNFFCSKCIVVSKHSYDELVEAALCFTFDKINSCYFLTLPWFATALIFASIVAGSPM